MGSFCSYSREDFGFFGFPNEHMRELPGALEFSEQSWWRSVGLLGELLWLLLRCDSVDALFERAGPARSAPPGVSGGREAHQALALAKGGAPSSRDFMEKCLGAETRCSGPAALETELWHSQYSARPSK